MYETEEGSQGLSVHENFNEGDIRVWWNLASDGWDQGDESNHKSSDRSNPIRQHIVLEEDTQINYSK